MTVALAARLRAYAQADQDAYTDDVRQRGLTALLAPYTLAGRLPRIPAQRRRS